ncbi:hypothetical protein ACWC9Q_11295 [Streptomyces sp. NPDC001142]|uniref:hypothetical protein n=1 Tax=Streptomyces sp. NPDC059616 TaxID=3346886 RepID=UPI0036795610
MATAVYEELQRDGRLGEAGVSMLVELMGQELRHFQVLTRESGFNEEAILEHTHAFFADKVRPLTVSLVVEAVDENAVRRITRISIRNWLVSRARKVSATGGVRRRVEVLLSEEAAFERVPESEPGGGSWRLAGSGAAPWDGDASRIVEAAASVRVRPVRAWKSETRRGPVAERADLVAILEAMLGAAGGSVEVAELTYGMSLRFPAWADPFETSLEGLHDEGHGEVTVVGDSAAQNAMIEAEALDALRQLSPQDRQVLLLLRENDVAEVQRIFACGRSSAYARMQTLRRSVADLVVDSEHPFAVVLRLEELCEQEFVDSDVSAASEHKDGTFVRITEGAK